jgi:signal transduction histidine kinase
MVQQMLRFAGRTETTRVPVDLTVVAREMLQMLRGALAPTVVAQTEFAPEPVEVMADVVGVRQVLMNLVVNASEAMAERGGRLLVRTGVQDVTAQYLRACQRQTCHGSASARPGSYAYVEVADTGKGMDAATRERIFDPFFSTKFAGRGLGLASVLGVVEAHEGVIHVSSRPGRGTTFRVLFPRVGG